MPKESMKIEDKDGSDMGESVGPDYVVCIKYERSYYSPHKITWYWILAPARIVHCGYV